MLRSRQKCILILTLLAAAGAWAEPPLIKVYVYDDVGVPAHVLLGAEDSTSRIFRQSGVRTLWLDCSPHSIHTELCRDNLNQTIMVRIVHNSRSMGQEVFGAAFLGTDGEGQYTTVFFDRVKELQRQCEVNLTELLGHIIAHEIGHVLLGFHAHSTSGVMRAVWDLPELKQAETGRLLFTSVQSKLMREKLTVRTAASHSELAAGE